MEKTELVEANEASPRAVGKLEEDAFTLQNEDWDKQSKAEKMPSIGSDDPEFGNEQEDISNKISSQAVEKLEGVDYAVQNEDHTEPKQVKSQNVCNDVPEYENEQDDISDKISSQAVEKLEGDACAVQNEDHTESKQVKSQNVCHDGPEYGNEQDGISDMVSSQATEKLEGDACAVQNEDHTESKQVKSQNVCHDGPEYENEQDGILDMVSSQATEKLEGDACAVQNEDHTESKQVKSQNVCHDGPEYENEQDGISDMVSSQATEKLEGDACAVQNEDHTESKQVKSQNVCHDGPEYENEQDGISDMVSSQATEKLEGDACAVQNEDHTESKQVKSQNVCHDGPEYENEQDGISDMVSSQATEKLEGDACAVQNEDHTESKQVKSQNVCHDGPEYENEQDGISDMVSSQATEKLEGDACAVQNEDHTESKQVKSQNVCHDGLEYENEQDGISDMVSSQATEKLEGDACAVQNEDHTESKQVKSQNVCHDGPEYENEQDGISDMVSSQATEKLEGDACAVQNEDHTESKQVKSQNVCHDGSEYENEQDGISDKISSQDIEDLEGDAFTIQDEDHNKDWDEAKIQNIGNDVLRFEKEPDDISNDIYEMIDVESNTPKEVKDNVTGESELDQRVDESRDLQCEPPEENLETSSSFVPCELFQKEHESNSIKSEIQVNIVEEYSGANVNSSEEFESKSQEVNLDNDFRQNDLAKDENGNRTLDSTQMNQKTDNTSNKDNNLDPVVDGVEVLGVEVSQCMSTLTSDADPEVPLMVEKAVALKNFVREKSAVAVSTLLRRLSRKIDEGYVGHCDDKGKDISDLSRDNESKEVSEKTVEKTSPLNSIEMSSDVDGENKTDQREEPTTEGPLQPIAMKGRIILYTRLGCLESKEVRQFLYMKRLRYVEINIDVYPNRKMELVKISGSTSVPKVFFNEILIGGLSELKTLNESGKLDEKIDFLITESPSFEGPFPPLSGEDDVSSSGALDEMALIVRKMKESIVVKDRFSKLRRFTNCFLGSEAVDFLSEDQYLERKEAVEFGRKLASKLFFQHVLDENLFEDGNHLYRFLDDDPIVASQCHNIPRGIITVKPKPITEIASRLRFLSYAMFEAYASEDGRHIDYRSMHGSEEFARYLRIVEELQRVEILDLSREEKLAFFINLYNMMTIHAILVWGHPAGALERRKLFGDFKYVIGGSTYSVSVIQNGILRGNLRLPYTLMKPFGANDKRLKVALSFPEPLIHFALVCGTRSGPALRCYSPGDIDKELMDAARNFLRNGGLLIDFTAKVAYASKILKWFSVDFGKNELEVMKHVSIYLDPADSELLFDLLATSELKVIYQPYDWGLNC